MRESPTARVAHRIDGLPGNDHGHDRGLAGAGRQLQRQTGKAGIGLLVGFFQMVKKITACLAKFWRHFSEPDDRFHRFHLAEEGGEPTVVGLLPTPVAE